MRGPAHRVSRLVAALRGWGPGIEGLGEGAAAGVEELRRRSAAGAAARAPRGPSATARAPSAPAPPPRPSTGRGGASRR